MELKKHNLLLFTRTMQLGGTENVIMQLCEIFKPIVNEIIVCSCGGINVKKLNCMSIVHYEIKDISDRSPKAILDTIIKLKQIIKNENVTIIHTHHRMAAFYVTLMRLYKKCVFINTSHNIFQDKKLLTKFSYKHANLVSCGEMVKKNLTEYYDLKEHQVKIIRNAVKPFNSKIVKDKTLSCLKAAGYFLIGNIGRLSEQKGMEYFIQAVPKVIEKHPETRFLIIGSGEDKQKLVDMVYDMNIRDYVIFMGYRTDVRNIMAQIDLVVLSSLWEGLPLTPIEAFSVGRTIVATNVDGTSEIVQDQKSGLLVEPKNHNQLAEKMVWIIEHPNKMKDMEQNALKRYKQEFAFERFALEYSNYYARIVG